MGDGPTSNMNGIFPWNICGRSWTIWVYIATYCQRSKAIGRQSNVANPLAFASRTLPSAVVAIAHAVTILRKVDARNH